MTGTIPLGSSGDAIAYGYIRNHLGAKQNTRGCDQGAARSRRGMPGRYDPGRAVAYCDFTRLQEGVMIQ